MPLSLCTQLVFDNPLTLFFDLLVSAMHGWQVICNRVVKKLFFHPGKNSFLPARSKLFLATAKYFGNIAVECH